MFSEFIFRLVLVYFSANTRGRLGVLSRLSHEVHSAVHVKHLHGPVIARIAVWYCTRDPRALEALSTEFLLQSAMVHFLTQGRVWLVLRGQPCVGRKTVRVFVFVSELWVDLSCLADLVMPTLMLCLVETTFDPGCI